MLSSDEIFLFDICQDSNSNLQSLMWLLSRKVNVNVVNSTGATPLHYCVKNNQIDFVQHLLRAGAYPNSRDNDGNFPLHFAIEKQSIKLIHLLAIAGASFKVKNNQRKTPQDLALASENEEFKDWLRDYRLRLKIEKQQALFIAWVYKDSNLLLQQTIEQQRELIQQQNSIIQHQRQQLHKLMSSASASIMPNTFSQQPVYPTSGYPLPSPTPWPPAHSEPEISRSYFFQKSAIEQRTATGTDKTIESKPL